MGKKPRAVDLFAGCGGLTAGLKRAGFEIVSAVEVDERTASTYLSNHPEVKLLQRDILSVTAEELLPKDRGSIDLVVGCPPCQGFSRVRRRNRPEASPDDRNDLVHEFGRLVEGLAPAAVFMENVPGIERDARFHDFLGRLEQMGYKVAWEILELSDYGIPQRRKRVVVLAGKGFSIPMPRPCRKKRTVREAIGGLPPPRKSRNPLHRQVTQHDALMLERISAVPKNGGSRCSWPEQLRLACHDRFTGFQDVYGRMAWDEPAPTITGGCINEGCGWFGLPIHLSIRRGSTPGGCRHTTRPFPVRSSGCSDPNHCKDGMSTKDIGSPHAE